MRTLLTILVALSLATPALARKPEEVAAVEQLFEEAKVEGTLVVLRPDGTETVVNPKLAAKAFPPMSTFKIPNTLIGLETGVITDEKFTLKWDGKKTHREVWNQDHDLASAMKHSVLWWYQEVARRVGLDKETEWVKKLDYGNMKVGKTVDRFWLEGPLRITPKQQVDFLRRLHTGKLPVAARSVEIVSKVLILDEQDGRVLRGKTGTGFEDGKILAWLVGWVTTKDGVYTYAMLLRADDDEGDRVMELRRGLADKVLSALGI